MTQGRYLAKKRHKFTDHIGEEGKILIGIETNNTPPVFLFVYMVVTVLAEETIQR